MENIHEKLYPHWGQYFPDCEILDRFHSGNQEIVLAKTKGHGKILLLDNIVQLTETGHFTYHEMITHPAMFAHGDAQNVLIVGGGDGGVAREVLRHRGVRRVVIAEIDQAVIDYSKKHFSSVSDGAFDDPRLTITIGDGAEYVKTAKEDFDVIIVDSTDPIEGLADVLFTSEFYSDCKNLLTPYGILIIQNGVPRMQGSELTETMTALREAGFNKSTCYLADTPDYVGGQMALGWASDLLHESRVATKAQMWDTFWKTDFGRHLHYYNPDVHMAAFALPNYIQKLLPE